MRYTRCAAVLRGRWLALARGCSSELWRGKQAYVLTLSLYTSSLPTAGHGNQDKGKDLASALASIAAAEASMCCPWLQLVQRLRPPLVAGVRAAPGAGCARGACAARAPGTRVRRWPLPETRAVRWPRPATAAVRWSSGPPILR